MCIKLEEDGKRQTPKSFTSLQTEEITLQEYKDPIQNISMESKQTSAISVSVTRLTEEMEVF
jgi:hypothetical protein